MSRIDGLLAFFFVYVFMIALGSSLGISTPLTAAVANWFNKRRGLAFGIMWSGVGIGGLFVPALGWLIESYGWRNAALIVGLFVAAVGLPIAAVMRHRPEQYGYYPDGRIPDEVRNSSQAARPILPDLSGDFTAREALRTSSFWFLTLSIMARSVVSGGIGLHFVPFFVDLGASNITAAALAGSVGLMSIPGRFGLSALGDFVNKRYVMCVSLALMAVSIIFMARAQSVSAVIPVLVAFAAAQGGISVIPQSLIADYFGQALVCYHPGIPLDHPDAGNHRRPDHQRVRVRHDGQLRVRILGILRRGHTVYGPGVHGEAAGQAGPHTQGRRWLIRLSGASSVCEPVYAAIQ